MKGTILAGGSNRICKTASGEFLIQSLITSEGITSTQDILTWINSLNSNTNVRIYKTTLENTKWFYDEQHGQITNSSHTFFQISGIKNKEIEQPIILQNEIGYLGILCKPINGILHFLMQAKIEPVNVNKIQISPTIQATKSNFSQAHGGNKPAYLEWFLNAEKHYIIVDQLQSEQSSRFLCKRNRNIIIMLDKNVNIEELPSYKWMTLYQIKKLMSYNNLVNMDTRTVLSCIPFYKYDLNSYNTPLTLSMTHDYQLDILSYIYNFINNYKMFNENNTELVPLYSLKNWQTINKEDGEEYSCKNNYPFKIIFCDIQIDGREVQHWGQPLFEAQGMATFGLFTRIKEGIQEFLVCAKPEIGCFDKIELGPTIQMESIDNPKNDIEKLFFDYYNTKKENIKHDVVLSEEGGRFYHEQNKNIIIEIETAVICDLPPGYWWCTYNTLNKLSQLNNILNIQLRNLLSLLRIN